MVIAAANSPARASLFSSLLARRQHGPRFQAIASEHKVRLYGFEKDHGIAASQRMGASGT
jgi:hypothetical protein